MEHDSTDAALVRAVMGAVGDAVAELAEWLVGHRGAAQCLGCGASAVWLRGRPKTLHLLLGDVPPRRDAGSCAGCRRGWAPLDEQLGIDQSERSPRLVEHVRPPSGLFSPGDPGEGYTARDTRGPP